MFGVPFNPLISSLYGKIFARSGAPCQRFVGGSLQLWQSGLTALDFFDHVTDEYMVDEEGFEVEEDATEFVVPECSFALTTDNFKQLQVAVNPLSESNNYGIELYENTLHFISNL